MPLSLDLARRLIVEAREDDARMELAPWSFNEPEPPSGAVDIRGAECKCAPRPANEICPQHEYVMEWVPVDTARGIVRTRNNLAAMADALEAALAECERLGSYGAMMAEKRRRKDIGEQLDTIIADRDRLAAELQAAKDENERLRRLVGEACDMAKKLLRDPSAKIYPPDPRHERIAAIRREAGDE